MANFKCAKCNTYHPATEAKWSPYRTAQGTREMLCAACYAKAAGTAAPAAAPNTLAAQGQTLKGYIAKAAGAPAPVAPPKPVAPVYPTCKLCGGPIKPLAQGVEDAAAGSGLCGRCYHFGQLVTAAEEEAKRTEHVPEKAAQRTMRRLSAYRWMVEHDKLNNN